MVAETAGRFHAPGLELAAKAWLSAEMYAWYAARTAAALASGVGEALTDAVGVGLLVGRNVGRACAEEPQAARPRAEAAESSARSWGT
jgi:hypothetical protein